MSTLNRFLIFILLLALIYSLYRYKQNTNNNSASLDNSNNKDSIKKLTFKPDKKEPIKLGKNKNNSLSASNKNKNNNNNNNQIKQNLIDEDSLDLVLTENVSHYSIGSMGDLISQNSDGDIPDFMSVLSHTSENSANNNNFLGNF